MASSSQILSKFRGCLVGAVTGDCIGAVYEEIWATTISIGKIRKLVDKIDSVAKVKTNGKSVEGDNEESTSPKKTTWTFTDDTAMARSVAKSLIHNKDFNNKDMAERFSEEYFQEPFRGYGMSVTTVFTKLKETHYLVPYHPAKEQFDGHGSYGNGGAMRIAPASLFDYKFNDYKKLQKLAGDITRITHSHYQAIQGAVLQAWAVDTALRITDSQNVNVDKFIDTLIDRMGPLEQDGEKEAAVKKPKVEKSEKDDSKEDPSNYTYCQKLEIIRKFVHQEEPPTPDDINNKLGTDISALNSVPAAIYSFLYATKGIAELEDKNNFEKTVIYAISLGGDTDTIATMAAAIAGACYGIEQIPKSWQTCCEGVQDAFSYADDLHKLNTEQ